MAAVSERKEPSDRISSLAARLLRRPETATEAEVKQLAGAVLSMDVTRGRRDDTGLGAARPMTDAP